MANIMWICPTKNQNEFYDLRKLCSLLSSEFPKFDFDLADYSLIPTKAIEVRLPKVKTLLFTMYCNQSCHFFDDDKYRSVDQLDEMGLESLGDKLIEYIENGADVERCIEIYHSLSQGDRIDDICQWMRWYFKALIFDEGIHPEFVLPLEKRSDPKSRSGLIKKFSKWLIK